MSKKTKDVVTLMEKEWPVMTAEFRRLQREQYELFLKKQHDYGPGNISVGTMLQTEEEIQLSENETRILIDDTIEMSKANFIGPAINAFERVINKTFDKPGSASYIVKSYEAQSEAAFDRNEIDAIQVSESDFSNY